MRRPPRPVTPIPMDTAATMIVFSRLCDTPDQAVR